MQSHPVGNDTIRSAGTAVIDASEMMQEGGADGSDPPLRIANPCVRALYRAVLGRRPAFRQIVEKHGNKSVNRYVQEHTCFVYTPSMPSRQIELIKAVKRQTKERLGDEAADAVERQLQHYYAASTMDHCGPQYHPWALNFNLVSADLYRRHPDPDLQCIITLSFSNVSLNNFSFPRGFSFHVPSANGLTLLRLPLLPSRHSMHAVFNHDPYTAKDIDHLRTRLVEELHGDAPARTVEKMNRIIDQVYAHPSVLESQSYPEQITKMNALLWRLLYPRSAGEKPLHFVYLEQESIVAQLLCDHHLHADTLLKNLILDHAETTLLERHFDGVHDAFTRATGSGTYLFWALPPGSEKRLRLWRHGDVLRSDDGSFTLPLTADAVVEALRSKQIIPSTLTSLLTLCFYYGLRCFGGLGQVSYLPQMQAAYVRLLTELALPEEITQCASIPVQDLGGEMAVAFLADRSGQFVPATSIDLLLYGNRDTQRIIEEQAKSLTLTESLLPTLPTEYPMLYGASERSASLLALTADDIAMAMRESDRLHACACVHEQDDTAKQPCRMPSAREVPPLFAT